MAVRGESSRQVRGQDGGHGTGEERCEVERKVNVNVELGYGRVGVDLRLGVEAGVGVS